MPTTWKEVDGDARPDTGIIDHLARHGVLELAERLIDEGDDSPVYTPEQVRERLAKYPG
jgi:hypothetical protein